ncbi:methylated-DNA--[protein]-cysteine S-methyltransferase [Salidesulfovibrio brasiliensis]|uniref:methylated-DNA--[protein]-cysteine S-methyltransferase n=1 Tax=Salidesulfovibrio brasiliensis TaxID=221711 RepID=UPI0006D08DF0|nr:methylated-DNA--[protein]-cysteine S-methyltransferase [Salidesulfovibrio brasiliensis]
MRSETIVAAPLALELEWNGETIKALHLKWAKDATASPDPSATARKLLAALERYVAGQNPDWPDLPLDIDALPPFHRAALKALRDNVPSGDVKTYKQLAEMAGSPKAFRAAGQAMRNNPWPLVYPCHRINGSDGKLIGFGGADGDLGMKGWLQQHEKQHCRK